MAAEGPRDSDPVLSEPPSPTDVRRNFLSLGAGSRQGSSSELADERSPLLSRSRIRIQSAYGTPRHPHLSRTHSYTGAVVPGFRESQQCHVR